MIGLSAHNQPRPTRAQTTFTLTIAWSWYFVLSLTCNRASMCLPGLGVQGVFNHDTNGLALNSTGGSLSFGKLRP